VVSGAALDLQGLTCGYPGREVLHELDLSLAAGECVALLGPNGAGKSTLLNAAAGLLRPAAGSVRLDGAEVSRLPARERARRVAMVAQHPAAPFAFTVREWVTLGRTPYARTFGGETEADRAAVEGALHLAGVAELAERPIGELSGGERQRAALAQALAQEPRLLLLDEATAHLDLRHQMALLGVVRRLNRDTGLTVLAALHDVNLASLWFDRLLVLDQGRLAADGSPRAVATPELWRRVFGCRVALLDHPAADAPLLAPAPDPPPPPPSRGAGSG
jgi:iron complex transport system ATP-binding protein